ncbi:FRG domain-containing protein [Rhizobium sp. LjRoot254]|uniref:FRG domain-containing protein n=1 Tax=Rhizobium sp. LjRoot254 TaxID=3342297 RepID=UPI003ECD31E6
MMGQWRGRFNGYAAGEITVEIDELDQTFSGRACVFQDAMEPLVFVVQFETANKNQTQSFMQSIDIQRVADTTSVSRDELMKAFPTAIFPETVFVRLRKTSKSLHLNAETYSNGTKVGKITASLAYGNSEKKSKLKADRKVNTWEKFKSMVGKMESDRFIFRGQSVCKRLRTSFHRTNRRDLGKFVSQDIPTLHGVVTSKTKHFFDLTNNYQNAAFWNLLQHHGYPTPLLDWTHSPYVAAYFAFRERASADADPRRKIRIFMFDRAEWEGDYRQIYSVANVSPHFSILRPIALENPRAIPQQGICSITTVDDVEDYIELLGKQKSKSYLRVFELPYSERAAVLSELRLMGVAAGSLFPGIDGACEEMKLRNFAL